MCNAYTKILKLNATKATAQGAEKKNGFELLHIHVYKCKMQFHAQCVRQVMWCCATLTPFYFAICWKLCTILNLMFSR